MKYIVIYDIKNESYIWKRLRDFKKIDKEKYLFISNTDSIEKANITIMGLKISDTIERYCPHYPDELKLKMKSNLSKIAVDMHINNR